MANKSKRGLGKQQEQREENEREITQRSDCLEKVVVFLQAELPKPWTTI